MQEQALPRLNLADGGRCAWEPRGPVGAPCSALPSPISPFPQAPMPHGAVSQNGAGIKVLGYGSADRRGGRAGKQRGCRSWTLRTCLLSGHLVDKAWGSWMPVTATSTGPPKFQKTLSCMLLFLLFQFGWPLECHPTDPS